MSSTYDVRLDLNPQERTWYESLADVYSVVAATDLLERAFVRDACSEEEYTAACTKLISQYEIAKQSIAVGGYDVNKFFEEYQVGFKAGQRRLALGVATAVAKPTILPRHVAEATQFFITAMDGMKLNLDSVDQIQPLIKDLLEGLSKLPILPADFEGIVLCKQWLTTLNSMSAADVLSDTQRRQLLFDLESSYNSFHRLLEK